MTGLQVFTNEKFGSIRMIGENGKMLFSGIDVANALGYSNTRDALTRHCKGVVKRDTPTNGGIQALSYIPEGDVYRLITHSKLPAAEQFESWVFDEVLPTIRRDGKYTNGSIQTTCCTYNNRPVATIRQIAEHAGVALHAAQRQFNRHRDEFIYGTEYEILYGCQMEQFKSQNNGFRAIQRLTVFTPEGTRRMLEFCKRCKPIEIVQQVPAEEKQLPQKSTRTKQEIVDRMKGCIQPIRYILDFITYADDEEEIRCYSRTLQNFTTLIFKESVEFDFAKPN